MIVIVILDMKNIKYSENDVLEILSDGLQHS